MNTMTLNELQENLKRKGYTSEEIDIWTAGHQSGGNYTADDDTFPTEVTFANGRRVGIAFDGDKPFLTVSEADESVEELKGELRSAGIDPDELVRNVKRRIAPYLELTVPALYGPEKGCEGCGHPEHGIFCDTRTEMSNGDKDVCLCETGYISKNQPISPTSGEDLKDAVECLENLAIGLLAEAKSTATKSLRAKQCEIRSKAMFTVLDALKSKEANDER